VLVLLPLSAFAQDGNPRVYIIPAQAVGDENNIATGLDSAVLGAVGENPIVVLTPVLSNPGGDLGALAGRYRDAKKLIDSEPEKAVEAIKSIIEGYEAAAAGLEDFEPYLEALAGLSSAYFNAGYEDEFVSAAQQIAVIRSTYTPNDAPEDVLAEIEKARTKLKKATPGTIKIVSSDPALVVRVDGVEQDTKKTIQAVPGVHLVVVSAPGKSPYVEKVKVSSGAAAQVNAALNPAADGPSALEQAAAPPKELLASIKKGTIDGPLRKSLAAFGDKNKAQLVVVTLVARDSGKYRVSSYGLRPKDAAMVELGTSTYVPGGANPYGTGPGELLSSIVKVTFDFTKAKAVPPSPALVITPKGRAPAAVGSSVKEATAGGDRVEPYAVEIVGLASDSELKAPPDARGALDVEDAPSRYTWFGVMPSGFGGFGGGAAPAGAYAGPVPTGASPFVPGPVDEPREPLTWGTLKGKWWFWSAVGVVGLGAAGAGGYAIFRPRGLDTTITFP
jgi:hypothetical protein